MLNNKKRRFLDPKKIGRNVQTLEKNLRETVIGQDEVIKEITGVYQIYTAGLCSSIRPICNFLFLGPTGTGKTHTVEALAEILAGTSKAVIKINCAEFQRSHEIAKLIGAPPGYTGHRETHSLLSQEVLNEHHTKENKISFVLFDEIEKANEALWNLLLGILDKATLNLGDNSKVNFSQAMIFMTSNLGATEMSEILEPRFGFRTPSTTNTNTEIKIKRSGLEAARHRFSPEFMNRLDKVVVFKTLGKPELRKILDIELHLFQNYIFDASMEKGFIFSVTFGAKEFLLMEGTDIKYGARHLKRAIERFLTRPLSNLIATNQIHCGDLVRIDYEGDGELKFSVEEERLTFITMARIIEDNALLVKSANAFCAEAEA